MDNAGFKAQKLTASSPEEICRLFQKYMAKGDIDLVLSLYDEDVVFLNQSSEPKRGKEALRKELAPFLHPRRPALTSILGKSSKPGISH